MIGMGGFLIIWQMTGQTAKPIGPPSIKIFSSSEHELLLDGLFSGDGRIHKLTKGSKNPTLQVSQQPKGKSFVKLELGRGGADSRIRPPTSASVEKLGKLEVKEELTRY